MSGATYDQRIRDAAKRVIDPNAWGDRGWWYRDRPDDAEIRDELREYWEQTVDTLKPSGTARASVVDDLVKAISARLDEKDEILDVFVKEFGFDDISTGGGCEAFEFILDPSKADDPPHILVTDNDAAQPVTWDTESTFGVYESYDGSEGDYVSGTVRELVDRIRAGTIHPKWPCASKAPLPSSSYDPEDVKTINHHRSSIGGDPIDLSAGWTVDEIKGMADSIRRTGKTFNNPDHSQLKRKLLR